MEAAPKLPFTSFDLKVSPEQTHFGPTLKQYIAEAYREDPESYSNEIYQLEGLRSAAVRPTIDAAGLSALYRYFCQLRSLQSRFPMAKGQPAACSFSWKDLYANMSCSLADLRFEMACILYNIGALHTQLGALERRTTADSLKAACTHFQNAAWAFQHLREQYPQPPGVDVSTEIMRFLQKFCFAQAQECILEKSIQDSRKSSVVGAVATQVLLFYKNALALLGPSTGSDNIHEIIGTKLYNYWYKDISFKAAYIGCIVCLYQGMNSEEQQKMGERVAFYQQAVDKLNEARKLAKFFEPVERTQELITFTHDVVEGKRKAAKNENEFIYHEEVPEKDLLMEMKPVCLVKAMPINFNDPEISGPDIFSRLVPICAHEASSMYSEEKAKLLRHIVSQAEAKNTEIIEFMSSLQLDQLEVIDSEQKIPQEVVDRCAAMNAKSEIIQSLVDSMNNLAEIISDVEHSLTEIKSLIQEETMKEKEYQKTMGPRPPSIVQTELSREYHKYHEAHTRTNESNQVLHKAMTLHIANLKLLAQPLDVLQSKIPSIDNIEGLDRETMSEMRRVVGKAREMQTQRDSLIQQLREAITSDDITSQLLARSSEPAEEIFKQELEKHTPKVKIIEQNLAAQENIINKLTSLYASYGESRRLLTDVLRKREGLVNALVTSYDTYEELLGKSQKGLEFYKKLSHNVNQLLTRLKGTCQVQEEERAQLLAKNSKPSTPTPSITPTPRASDLSASNATPLSAPPAVGGSRKLKDYLPYMKNRTAGRSVTPQGQLEAMPAETYYPESIYPTSVRPTPVGSEATDMPMQLPDGVVMPQMQGHINPCDRYGSPYAPSETDPYGSQHNYAYAATSKGFEKPEENPYGYSPYTPQQFSSQVPDQSQQIYSNPYYSATHNNGTVITDSQSSMQYPTNTNQANTANQYGANTSAANQANVNPNHFQNDPYMQKNQANPIHPIPDVVPTGYSANQSDLSATFSQMQISGQKPEPGTHFGGEYTQTFYSVQYPQANTPNMATYSHAPQNSNMSMVSAPSDYSSLNYPYSSDSTQYGQVSTGVLYSGQGTSTNVPYSAGTSTNVPYNAGTNVPYSSGTITNQPYSADTSTNAPYSAGTSTNVPYSSGTITNAPYSPGTGTNVSYSPDTSTNAPYSTGTSTQVPYSAGANTNVPYSADQYYATSSYANESQGYPTYIQTDSTATSTTSDAKTASAAQPYSFTPEPDSSYMNPALSHFDSLDKPIKSHAKGEALSSNIPFTPRYQTIDNNAQNIQNPQVYANPSDQSYQTNTNYTDQSNNFVQGYQNHPGYTYNAASGNCDYAYGSQNSVSYDPGNQGNVNAKDPKDPNWSAQGVYTSAGMCDTVQSPSAETPGQSGQPINNQIYYNSPYGYITNTNQAIQMQDPQTPSSSTNYGANVNQSTYMQSGQGHDTNVTYANNQVSTPKENLTESPNFDQNIDYNQYGGSNQTHVTNTNQPLNMGQNVEYSQGQNMPNQATNMQAQPPANFDQNTAYSQDQNQANSEPVINAAQANTQETTSTEQNNSSDEVQNQNVPTKLNQPEPAKPAASIPETKSEPSVFDLLSGIDFTVEQKPLIPEIKVPQMSESAIKKSLTVRTKADPIQKPPPPKDEVLERPAKKDLFSDPSLLNKLTQEVKSLQVMTDSLTNVAAGGLTVLDLKWKHFQDVQTKENMTRSKTVAMQHSSGNIVTDVVPYDDSRLTLKSDPDAYINASYYKQLAPWCIPLVISKNPTEEEYSIFWKAVLENKISCVVCLLSEIEMQGKSYWPTAKGQSLELSSGLKVTLDEVICNVHWTERKLSVANVKTVLGVTHYQVNVFPAKIVCSPLVVLVDKILSQTYDNRLSNQLCGAWIQCASGAGRSALVALLTMVVCQVRAGQLNLCDMLDAGCINLIKQRSNVLEDTKYLADAYRTALFYVQGVLCSGTTMFNGEAVSLPSGASVLPPVNHPSSAPSPPLPSNPKHKFSRESFEEMKQSPGLKSGDMKDPLNFLDPLWSLKKK